MDGGAPNQRLAVFQTYGGDLEQLLGLFDQIYHHSLHVACQYFEVYRILLLTINRVRPVKCVEAKSRKERLAGSAIA